MNRRDLFTPLEEIEKLGQVTDSPKQPCEPFECDIPFALDESSFEPDIVLPGFISIGFTETASPAVRRRLTEMMLSGEFKSHMERAGIAANTLRCYEDAVQAAKGLGDEFTPESVGRNSR